MASPEQPKKPQTAYWLWLSDNREALAKEAGTGKGSVVSKLGGQKWNALDPAKKEPFEKRAVVAKAEYEKAMEAFKAAGGEVVRRKRKEKDVDEDGKRRKKRAKKEKDKDAPKKPGNPYWLWLGDNRAAITKEAGTGAAGVVGKLAGEKWKALPDTEKKKYEDKAAALKIEYEKAMAEYKKNKPTAAGGDSASDDGSDKEESDDGEEV